MMGISTPNDIVTHMLTASLLSCANARTTAVAAGIHQHCTLVISCAGGLSSLKETLALKRCCIVAHVEFNVVLPVAVLDISA
jgi:hypothetical protein